MDFSTTSPTKTFLARVVAWPQEGEAPAFVNIHYTFEPSDKTTIRRDKKSGREILPWAGNAYKNLNDAANGVNRLNTGSTSRDIYFCTSSQAFAQEKTSAKGFKFNKALRSSDGAVKMKALFIDSDLIDGKNDDQKHKGYESKEAFGAALVEFLKATGLPRPTIIVSSGGGFHMYWCLMRALTIEEWLPLSYALAEATKRTGFKCDPQVTIDAARVLRIPGTRNFKYDPPRWVSLAGTPVEYDYAVDRIEACLEPYKVQVPYSVRDASMTILPPKAPIEGLSDLASGIDTSSMAPVKIDSLNGVCGFITEALTTGGANFDNPLWNLTTLIATFTENGRADAHRMACGHSTYGPGEQDELFDRKVEEKMIKDLGWPKCSTISSTGCTSCATCPLFADNKSPLNFGVKVATLQSNHVSSQGGFSAAAQSTMASGPNMATAGQQAAPAGGQVQSSSQTVAGTGAADPDLPANYLRNPNGVVLYPQQNDDGTMTWIPVSRYPMTQPWMQRDPWSLNFTTETEYGKTSQVSVPLKDVGTAEMKKSLQEQGFMVGGGPRGFNNLSEFIMAWITKLQSTRDSVITSVPFGWLVRSGKVEGFVYGGKLHTPTGEEIASNTDPELQRQFSPEGTLQPWLDAANMITVQKRPSLDAIIASSFAAPLVRFTGHSGLLMSAYSVESGIGKSTALKVAQAIWGDPVKAVQGLSDTQNSVLNKLGELRSLPIYWDEMKTDEDTKKFVDLVFRLSGGVEKSRMTAKVTQRVRGSWQTIMVSASNESLMDSIAYKTRTTTAGLYRVFEYTVKPAVPGSPGQIDPTVAQRILSKLHDNYGVVGYHYASFLGTNHVQVEADMAAILADMSKETGMAPDERFWVALIACILQGAKYANQLGYANIDEVGLKVFMLETLREMRSQRNIQPVDMRNVVNVVNTLARFLNENRARHTLATNIIYRSRGKPPANTVNTLGDPTRLDSIHVHIGVDDKTVRIGQAYLYDWLAQNNYSRHVFLKALQTELGARTISGRLGAGTSLANATEYLLEIDLNNSNLMNFLDEA